MLAAHSTLPGINSFFQLLFLAAYFGTPLFILWWWVSLARSSRGKPMWLALGALGLWLLQVAVWLAVIIPCLSGHCRPTALQEYGPIVLTICAYAAIGAILWLAWKSSAGEEKRSA